MGQVEGRLAVVDWAAAFVMAVTLRVGRALAVRQRALVSCCSNSRAPRERATLCATMRSWR
jgi:hypothetical protein